MNFLWNKLTFDQQYLSTGVKTQNVEKLSVDLVLIAILRIHWKPDRNWQELSVCTLPCILSDRNARTISIFQKFLIFSLHDSFIPSYGSLCELYNFRRNAEITCDIRGLQTHGADIVKVRIFWEGHKILWKLHPIFVYST